MIIIEILPESRPEHVCLGFHVLLNPEEGFLELGAAGHVDDEVGGGVDGESQVRDHAEAVDPGGQIHPASRGTSANI